MYTGTRWNETCNGSTSGLNLVIPKATLDSRYVRTAWFVAFSSTVRPCIPRVTSAANFAPQVPPERWNFDSILWQACHFSKIAALPNLATFIIFPLTKRPTDDLCSLVILSSSRLRVPTALLYAFQCARQIPNSIRLSSTKTSHIHANNNRLSSGFVPSNREISRCSEVYTRFTISSASSRFARNLDCWLWKRASVQGHERAHLYTHRHWKYRVAGDD